MTRQPVLEVTGLSQNFGGLRAINDLSYTEIAQVLQIQEGTVKSRLSRARTMLRNKLLQTGNNSDTASSNQQKGGMRDEL